MKKSKDIDIVDIDGKKVAFIGQLSENDELVKLSKNINDFSDFEEIGEEDGINLIVHGNVNITDLIKYIEDRYGVGAIFNPNNWTIEIFD